MSEQRPRRSRIPDAPEAPSGYRQTRRSSTAARTAKRAERRYKVVMGLSRTGKTFKNVLLVIVQGLALAAFALLVLLVVANGVNTFVRWNAQRLADEAASPQAQERKARENVLYIGVEETRAVGYLAIRVDQKGEQVYGIAIPEGAFVDIPGRGFERIGEAYTVGPDTALTTVSNFFTVQFQAYVTVPAAAYRDALAGQRVSGFVGAGLDTNLSDSELSALEKGLSTVPQKNVNLVPMPTKPIKLGDQTYLEPQRDEIADVLKQWWGVDTSKGDQMTRVILYNGAGTPGIAGQAAQQLIRAGFRVIDTKNADSFGYKTTLITVKRGDKARGDAVRKALGVGTVKVELSSADVTDVIVVIGKDYQPKAAEEGKQ